MAISTPIHKNSGEIASSFFKEGLAMTWVNEEGLAMTWVNEEGLAMTWNEMGKDDATDVIALKIAFQPFALSLSKGPPQADGSTSLS